ncbi:MAG: DUF3501 family protein [Zoogloeaceae bacterium]|jgi:hypothetical protein|nr:DUF3501 family protein [Zoogloeaceae bacterium]
MLTHEDLFSLEKYARVRPEFRAKVMAHKKSRQLPIGAHATLYFEDTLTMQYQVQEMLRLERMFEPALIQEELDVYNPLIPNGRNWKATFMIEYSDETERRSALAQLLGIEKRTWVQVDGCEKVYAIANEDLDRETDEKTAAVHFLRFELTPPMIAAAKNGAAIRAGIDHDLYHESVTAPPSVRESLVADLA